MIKKLTRNLLSTILTVLLAVGVFGIAAPKEVHAASTYTYTITIRCTNGGANFQGVTIDGTFYNASWSNVSESLQVDALPSTISIKVKNKTNTLDQQYYNTNGVKKNVTVGGQPFEVTSSLTSNHTHDWSEFSASNNKITAICKGSGTCPETTAPTLTLNATNKTYDGSVVTATLEPNKTWTSYNLGTPTITYDPANSKNAGTYTARVTKGSATATKQFTISPKQLTLNWGSTTTFDYDGNSHAPTATISGVVSGDTCNVSVGGAEVNAGNHTATASLTGANAGNYKLPDANTKAFTINKKLIDLTDVLANPKVYDSTTVAVLDGTNAKISGVLSVDEGHVEIDKVSGSYSDKNVETGKAVTATASLKGDKSNNYEVNPLSSLSADITPKTVTVTDGIAANDKDYDGNTDATIDASKAIIDGLCDGDILIVNATGTFNDANVGEKKPVNLTYGTLGGTDAGNYVLATSGNQPTTTASIKALPMTVSATGVNVEYDGNPHHITVTVTNPSNPDDYVIAYKGPNDSEYVPHKNPTFTDTGEYTVYYRVTSPHYITEEGSATVKITGEDIKGIISKDYEDEYDGKPHTIDIVIPTGCEGCKLTFAESEDGPYTETPIFRTDASTTTVYFKVTRTGYNDYKGSQIINITKIPVTISGIKAKDRVYDGTTDVELVFSNVNIDGLLDGETLVVTAKGSFADKNSAAEKTVTISELAITGSAAKNYELAASGQQTSDTASVSMRPITVKGISSNGKIYDGTTEATSTLYYDDVQLDGMIKGDSLGVTAEGTFGDGNVGKNKTITLTNLTLTGDDNRNYDLVETGQQTTTTGNIAQQWLTITADDQQKVYGVDDPEFTYDVQGLVVGDNITGSLSRQGDESVGEHRITRGTLDAGGNYAIDYTPGTLTITKATSNVIDSVLIEGWTYGNEPKKPTATATHGADTATFTYSDAEDGTYTSEIPTNAGTYYVKATVAETDNYPGAISEPVEFEIAKKQLTLNWGKTDFIYNGKEQKPTATLKGFVGDDTCEVTVSGEKIDSNVKAGTDSYTATATITGVISDNYKLPTNKTVDFTIEPKQLDHDMLEFEPSDTIEADPSGKEVGPNVVMGDPDIEEEDGGVIIEKQLKENEDYTVSGTTKSNKYGTHEITVTGKGNYKDTINTSWILLDEKTDKDIERVGDNNSFIEIFVTIEGNTENISAPGFTMALAKTLIDNEEMAWLEEEDGEKITIYLEIIEEPIGSVDEHHRELILNEFKKQGAKDIRWFDIKVWKKVGKESAKEINTKIPDIAMIIEVPDEYKKAPANHKRSFYLATYHNGWDFAKILTKTSKTEVEFASNEFSTFALAFKDTPNPDDRRLPKTGVE